MDKYEYLIGEDLGSKPSTVEQAKFEYSPLDKIFNRGLSEDDKKEGLFKRLKNIENKIKDENKKELKSIKNEEQSEALKVESTVDGRKPKKIVLLKDKLDYIIKSFDSNFNSIGKNFLIKLAKDEKRINYNNLFFSIGDNSIVKDADFLKEIGTLQIKVKNKKKKIFAEQENVLSNAEMLLEKRIEWIGQSRKNNKIANDEKFYDAPEKSEESISEKSEQKSDQSVLK